MKKRHSEHGPVTVHGRRFATLRGPNGWAQAIGDVRADAIARGSTLGYVQPTRPPPIDLAAAIAEFEREQPNLRLGCLSTAVGPDSRSEAGPRENRRATYSQRNIHP